MPGLQAAVPEGAAETVVPLAEPQAPGVVAAADLLAEHETEVPPPEPAQLHVQGPAPDTAEADPLEQRLVVGADETVVPLTEPHEPLTGVAGAEHEKLVVATALQSVPLAPVELTHAL